MLGTCKKSPQHRNDVPQTVNAFENRLAHPLDEDF